MLLAANKAGLSACLILKIVPKPREDMNSLLTLLMVYWLSALAVVGQSNVSSGRILLREIFLSETVEKQISLLGELKGRVDPLVELGLRAWRAGEIFIFELNENTQIPFVLVQDKSDVSKLNGLDINTNQLLNDEQGSPLYFSQKDLNPLDTTAKTRKKIKEILDLGALESSDEQTRLNAAIKLGDEQNIDYLETFKNRTSQETSVTVLKVLSEAIARLNVVSTNTLTQIAGLEKLQKLRAVNSITFLSQVGKTLEKSSDPSTIKVNRSLRSTLKSLENYQTICSYFGTAFRGLSLSAVLLVAALGLSITFGLMGVINMAHGEIMAVGAYTTFFIQGLLGKGLLFSILGHPVSLPGMAISGIAFDISFLYCIVASFLMAGLVGLFLEHTIIRFLYKRPLESLLATYGVSLILQQVFRHTFGSANVQVDAPGFLQGSLVVNDVSLAYNRIFIIIFSIFVVLLTWFILTKTSLGLLIRAVMQNRNMASSLGVRTEQINKLTFALGSGLAGMAGACITQIANVGPSLGQNYIIDCFMVVVLGGVGNLVGTITASGTVGVTNQILEPWIGAVLGKISVLGAIILFLQWRPNGLFVTRSRNLDN